jgi:hypothetical protein
MQFLPIASEVLVNSLAMKVVNIPSTKMMKKFLAQVRVKTRLHRAGLAGSNSR